MTRPHLWLRLTGRARPQPLVEPTLIRNGQRAGPRRSPSLRAWFKLLLEDGDLATR